MIVNGLRYTVGELSHSQCISLYLQGSYTYYQLDQTFMSDEDYDSICSRLLSEFAEIDPSITYYDYLDLDLDALKCTTGYHIEDYPAPIMRVAERKLKTMD